MTKNVQFFFQECPNPNLATIERSGGGGRIVGSACRFYFEYATLILKKIFYNKIHSLTKLTLTSNKIL